MNTRKINEKIKILLSIENDLKEIKEKLVKKEIENNQKLKWMFLFSVIDRFFLLVAFIYFLITFTAFILINYNLYNSK